MDGEGIIKNSNTPEYSENVRKKRPLLQKKYTAIIITKSQK